MPQHRSKRGNLCRVFAGKTTGQQNGNRPFGPVQQQGQRGGGFVAGAQDIRRPDIARPDRPQIAKVHGARQQQSKGD